MQWCNVISIASLSWYHQSSPLPFRSISDSNFKFIDAISYATNRHIFSPAKMKRWCNWRQHVTFIFFPKIHKSAKISFFKKTWKLMFFSGLIKKFPAEMQSLQQIAISTVLSKWSFGTIDATLWHSFFSSKFKKALEICNKKSPKFHFLKKLEN